MRRRGEVEVEQTFVLPKGVTAGAIRKLVTHFALGELRDRVDGHDRLAKEITSDLVGAVRSVFSFTDEQGRYAYRSLDQFERHLGRRRVRRFDVDLDSRFSWEKVNIRSNGSRVTVRAMALSRDKAAATVEEAVLYLGLAAPGDIATAGAKLPAKSTYDAFISHAREDAATVARPLHDALKGRGYRIWLDRFQLKVGDSLRQSIDKGLLRSRHGIVVLSPSFFKKRKIWPPRELDGLFSREQVIRKRTILPVLHDLRARDLARYSPILAGRLAASTQDGIETVARELVASMGAPLRRRARPPRGAAIRTRLRRGDRAGGRRIHG